MNNEELRQETISLSKLGIKQIIEYLNIFQSDLYDENIDNSKLASLKIIILLEFMKIDFHIKLKEKINEMHDTFNQ
jgi:hypothetical protein